MNNTLPIYLVYGLEDFDLTLMDETRTNYHTVINQCFQEAHKRFKYISLGYGDIPKSFNSKLKNQSIQDLHFNDLSKIEFFLQQEIRNHFPVWASNFLNNKLFKKLSSKYKPIVISILPSQMYLKTFVRKKKSGLYFPFVFEYKVCKLIKLKYPFKVINEISSIKETFNQIFNVLYSLDYGTRIECDMYDGIFYNLWNSKKSPLLLSEYLKWLNEPEQKPDPWDKFMNSSEDLV